MTPSGIESATFMLVAQCLQLRHFSPGRPRRKSDIFALQKTQLRTCVCVCSNHDLPLRRLASSLTGLTRSNVFGFSRLVIPVFAADVEELVTACRKAVCCGNRELNYITEFFVL